MPFNFYFEDPVELQNPGYCRGCQFLYKREDMIFYCFKTKEDLKETPQEVIRPRSCPLKIAKLKPMFF